MALGARRPRARCQTSARGRALPSAVGAAWRASSLACTHRDTRRGRRLNEVCRLAPLLALVAAPLPEASLSPVKHSLPNYSPQRAPWSARMGYLWREGGGVLHAARSGGSIAANRLGRRGLARPCLRFSAAGSAAAGPARHCIIEHRASSFMHAREQEHIRRAASAHRATCRGGGCPARKLRGSLR